jgi:succinate dehydrogenase / fumarate reductase, membrane anchor subunit
MSMRTPLGRVRGFGAARTGTEHFWQQRLTAIANVPLVIFLVIFVVSHLGATRADMLASVRHPLVALMLILALTSILWHMRLGMQTIVEDYVHGAGWKIALVILNSFYAAALGAAGLYAILSMSFSGSP